jgi:carotenoid cleavage dioxygenase-like enzyme
VLAEIPVRHPAYMHSFAMTKNYIVLVEAPWRFTDIWGLIFQYKQPYLNDYEWQPGNPTIFTAISKKDGKVLKTWEADTFMALHNVNAFEKKDRLIVDLCAYKDNTLVNKLYFASLLQGDGGVLPPVQLRRYHLRLKSSVASYEVLSPEQADMPQINFMRFTSKPYRYMYGIGPASQIGDDFIDQLVKVDVQTTATKCWRQRECYPGEPVFVAKPDAKSEDEGVVLSLILDGEHNHSSLLVLDGQTFEEMGRINLPFLVPFGFHGAFYNNIV